MYCQSCQKSGLRREGGPAGICWKHQAHRAAEETESREWQRKTGDAVRDLQQLQEFKVNQWKNKLLDSRLELDDAISKIFRELHQSFVVIWSDSRPAPPEILTFPPTVTKRIEKKKAA